MSWETRAMRPAAGSPEAHGLASLHDLSHPGHLDNSFLQMRASHQQVLRRQRRGLAGASLVDTLHPAALKCSMAIG